MYIMVIYNDGQGKWVGMCMNNCIFDAINKYERLLTLYLVYHDKFELKKQATAFYRTKLSQ